MSASDSGRTALYEAEAAAFLGTDLETDIGVEAAVTLVADVVATAWWPGPPVVGRAARADARSSSARTQCASGLVTIRVAAGQATAATVAHELGHALAGVTHGHGPRFRRAYLDVVKVMTNLRSEDPRGMLHVDQLASAFTAFGLDVGTRQWPTPVGFGEPIAL